MGSLRSFYIMHQDRRDKMQRQQGAFGSSGRFCTGGCADCLDVNKTAVRCRGVLSLYVVGCFGPLRHCFACSVSSGSGALERASSRLPDLTACISLLYNWGARVPTIMLHLLSRKQRSYLFPQARFFCRFVNGRG